MKDPNEAIGDVAKSGVMTGATRPQALVVNVGPRRSLYRCQSLGHFASDDLRLARDLASFVDGFTSALDELKAELAAFEDANA